MTRIHPLLPLSFGALAACQPGATPEVATQQSRALEAMISHVRPEATPEQEKLQRALGPHVLGRFRDGRPRSLFGLGLGEVQLEEPLDEVEAERAVRGFLTAHADLYGLAEGQAQHLELVEVQKSDRLGLQFQQRHHGLRVVEGRLYAGFSVDGRLMRIVGRPVPQDKLPSATQKRVSMQRAEGAARDLAPDIQHVEAELVMSEVRGLGFESTVVGPTIESTAWVDARTGVARILHDDIGHLLKSIPVTHYRHNGGSRTETVSVTGDINVDIQDYTFLGLPTYCMFQLQRLGSGRARIWQGFGEPATPSFSQSSYFAPCTSDEWFTQLQGATSDRQFNEQHTYVWAQRLKTFVDNWGRRPNSYGHYPVDSGRDVNVEIVVNGSSSRELDWCGTGVQHGCFRRSASRSWFNGHPGSGTTVPAVFLFNVGNSSYHFNGTDNSASYAIIAHEVGHFISWTYGRWQGPIRSSINEGFSMVIAGLMAKDRWSAIDYADDDEVTTGGPMWDRHTNSSNLEVYAGMSCGDNAYELARPFVQFMWRLMNNQDHNGDPVWSTDEAAIRNTADRFMDAMHDLAGVSTVEWDDVADHIFYRTYESIYVDGTEQGVLPASFLFSDSLVRMWSLVLNHGLDGTCI